MDNFNEEQKEEVQAEIVNVSSTDKKKIDLSKYSLLISILFLIFGAVLATNPGDIVNFISYIIGGVIILIGVIKILLFVYAKKKYDIVKFQDIISGIILCILGIIACIWGSAVTTLIRIIVGAWILYCGISNLIVSIKFEHKFNITSPLLILSLVMITIGIATIMITYIEFRILGIMILLYSITDIVSYILNQNKK